MGLGGGGYQDGNFEPSAVKIKQRVLDREGWNLGSQGNAGGSSWKRDSHRQVAAAGGKGINLVGWARASPLYYPR